MAGIMNKQTNILAEKLFGIHAGSIRETLKYAMHK